MTAILNCKVGHYKQDYTLKVEIIRQMGGKSL
uniref:Uncharacterized protein n=1 Tax=Rhizophora mucronata TaxID=61149 RepID=A0A2P2R3P3_RHIMU